MIQDTLQACVSGQPCSDQFQTRLLQHMQGQPLCSQAFGLSSADDCRQAIARQWHLLQAVYPDLQSFCCDSQGWANVPLETAWQLWIPLAIKLADAQRSLGRPLVQGVLGGQGSGKSTLGAVLLRLLPHLSQQMCSISIDDLYKTYHERQALQQQDPRLLWRGPPGTHDVALGIEVLQQIKTSAPGTPFHIPRFDKSAWGGAGDRTEAEVVSDVSIVWFEGWFVGARPIPPSHFDQAPPPIVTEDDRTFACDTNQRLHDYLPLWNELDQLMVLYPTDYRMSQQWRREAEQQMKASGRDGMGDDEINRFVTYFWRSLHPELFITPLLTNRDAVDLVVEIDAAHCPCAIYRPSNSPSETPRE